MKGKSNSELAAIDVELKEAVCDALVNALVQRVAGADERGRNLLGSSPRRGIFAGQLLPRFEPSMRYSGDWVALLGSARRGPAACVAERLTYWRIHSNNTFVRSPNR